MVREIVMMPLKKKKVLSDVSDWDIHKLVQGDKWAYYFCQISEHKKFFCTTYSRFFKGTSILLWEPWFFYSKNRPSRRAKFEKASAQKFLKSWFSLKNTRIFDNLDLYFLSFSCFLVTSNQGKKANFICWKYWSLDVMQEHHGSNFGDFSDFLWSDNDTLRSRPNSTFSIFLVNHDFSILDAKHLIFSETKSDENFPESSRTITRFSWQIFQTEK